MSDSNTQTPEISTDTVVHRLFKTEQEALYRFFVWCFVGGSCAHLWLLDATHDDWLLGNIVYIGGLLALLVRCYPIGWLLSAIGVAIPLLFARDQLTQSMFLFFVSSTCCVGAIAAFLTKRSWRREVFSIIGALTVATYAFATFHKLNTEFLDPTMSCAVYGMQKVATYWHLPLQGFEAWSPHITFIFEGGIVVLYLFRQRHAAWILAAAFHIPLTVTMAPAFAFVMAIGHVAFMTPNDLIWLRNALTSKRGILSALVAAVATAVSLGRFGKWPEFTMVPKEWALWFIAVLLVLHWRSRPIGRYEWKWTSFATVVVFLFVLNGFSPYLGVQYQHTGAMLSNLRIDQGCWNHLIVPESVRLSDDYVRIDTTYLKSPGHIKDYEKIVLEQLWSPPQLGQMRRNWCSPSIRPFYISGTYRGEPFEIQDLCRDTPIFENDGVFGRNVFPDFLRFQKNLIRECPQTCIH